MTVIEQSKMKRYATWRDLNSERVQLIIKLKKQFASVQEIGDSLGVSKERASQLVNKIAKEHGSDVFTPDEPAWRLKEVAAELGISYHAISYLRRRGEIPFLRHTVNGSGYFLLTQEGIDALKKYLAMLRERTCKMCGKAVLGNPQKLYCSSACKSKFHYQKSFSGQPTVDSLTKWRRELWKQLQLHMLPENERWIVLSEVSKITGLSKMQISWLGKRHIITTSQHPTKLSTREGKPLTIYAASEIEIVRQIYAKYKKS